MLFCGLRIWGQKDHLWEDFLAWDVLQALGAAGKCHLLFRGLDVEQGLSVDFPVSQVWRPARGSFWGDVKGLISVGLKVK